MPPGLTTARCALLLSLCPLAFAPAQAGAAWSAPVTISPPDHQAADSPKAAIGPDGSVYVTWNRLFDPEQGLIPATVELVRISPAGDVGNPVALTAKLTETVADRNIAVGADGTVAVAWISGWTTQPAVQVVRIAPNGTVGAVRTLYTGTTEPRGIQVVVDAQGQATVIWDRNTESRAAGRVVEAARLRSDGTASIPQIVGSATHYAWPAAAIQPNGVTLLAWSGASFTTLTADGVQGETVDLDPGHPGGSMAIAAATNSGIAAVAWSRESDNAIIARRIARDATLGTIQQLSPPGQQGASPHIGISSSGAATVAWSDFGPTMWLSRMAAEGSTQPAVSLGLSPGGVEHSSGFGIAVDMAGKSTAVWLDGEQHIRAAGLPAVGSGVASAVISRSDESPTSADSFVDRGGTVTALWQARPSDGSLIRMARNTPQPPPACASVKLIGAAGSGENGGPGTSPYMEPKPGLGKPVQALYRELKMQLEHPQAGRGPAQSVKNAYVNYPAVPVGNDNWIQRRHDAEAVAHSGEYQASVNSGARELSRMLAAEAAGPCADHTDYVLAGYSQGAQVVAEVLEQSALPATLLSHIRSVVFFGDPEFRAADPFVTTRGTFDDVQNGRLGARTPTAFAGIPPGMTIDSYCRAADPVCQSGANLFNREPHLHYQSFESSWASWRVAQRLSPRGVTTGRAPAIAAVLVDEAGGKEAVKFKCHGQPSGICLARADVVFRNFSLFPSNGANLRRTVKAAGRTDKHGNYVKKVTIPDAFRVTLAQADVEATVITRDYGDAPAELSIILR